MPSNPTNPKWDALFEAQHQLFIAAKHTLQAMTLQARHLYTGSHDRFALEALTAAAEALGYKLVKADAPASSTVTILPLDAEEEEAA